MQDRLFRMALFADCMTVVVADKAAAAEPAPIRATPNEAPCRGSGRLATHIGHGARLIQQWTSRTYSCLILSKVLLFLTAGCAPIGPSVPNGQQAPSVIALSKGAAATARGESVVVEEVEVRQWGESMAVTLYQPKVFRRNSPAIVFLPGLMAPVDQYESYAQALASRGFIVAMHDWYSPFTSDIELARESSVMADWLVQTLGVDPHQIGIAGHSMGGKDAILAAANHGGFSSVVAIDPDDAGEVSVVQGPLARLRAPLLLIGAEVAWQAASICAPSETNYERFFERSPPGTVELILRDADHVQMLDEPDRFGYGICRVGTADSQQVHDTTLRATVGFFAQHLQAGPVLTRQRISRDSIRIAQGDQILKD